MNKNAIEFLKKIESIFGTRKIVKSCCISGAVLFMCLAFLPDEQKETIEPIVNNLIDNKEEK